MARTDFVLANGTRVHRATCGRIPGDPVPLDQATDGLLAVAQIASCCKPKAAQVYITEAAERLEAESRPFRTEAEGFDTEPVKTIALDGYDEVNQQETEKMVYGEGEYSWDEPDPEPVQGEDVAAADFFDPIGGDDYQDAALAEKVSDKDLDEIIGRPEPTTEQVADTLGQSRDTIPFPKQYRRALGRGALLIAEGAEVPAEADFKAQVVHVHPEGRDLILSAWEGALASVKAYRQTDEYRAFNRKEGGREANNLAYQTVERHLEEFAAGVADVVSGQPKDVTPTEGRIAGRSWAEAWGGIADDEA